MRKNHSYPRGEVTRLTISSKALLGNFLGDPAVRPVDVYVPPGTDGRGLPLFVDLVGFTGSGLAHTGWKAFAESVPERLDRLIGTGAMPPVVCAFPDCFTRLGGNQYIDSSVMGAWEQFLVGEVVPAVESKLGCGGAGRRAVFGKSSGGYGSLVHAMLHADTWSAAACHSGDMAFELCYLGDMPAVLRALAKHDGDIARWVEAFESNQKPSSGDIHVLMALAMAATYDPDLSAPLGVRLPVDPRTCELIQERWEAWRRWDPLEMVAHHAAALRSLRALYIDCGDIDQYNLVYGARRMHAALDRLGVPHRYEEFPDDHSGVDYRMDESLPYLAKALA